MEVYTLATRAKSDEARKQRDLPTSKWKSDLWVAAVSTDEWSGVKSANVTPMKYLLHTENFHSERSEVSVMLHGTVSYTMQQSS